MYLKNKGILLNLIDLLDIQGKTYVFEELIPIEECFLMWLSTRFITKELLDNGEYNRLEKIVDDYLYEIDKCEDSANLKNILSKEHKEKNKVVL